MKSKLVSLLLSFTSAVLLSGQNVLKPVATHTSSLSAENRIDESAAEIPAHDPLTQRVFVGNDANDSVEVLQLGSDNKGNPTLSYLFNLDLNSIGSGVNAVASKNGLVAVAVHDNQNRGKVVIYSASVENNASALATITVGYLPDHLAFTNDGNRIVVANEGEPNDAYTIDPVGSISVIDLYKSGNFVDAHVVDLNFSSFDSKKGMLLAQGVRIFGNNGTATVSEDLEPEYVAITEDDTKAFVTLQENNAFAVVDLVNLEITEILPLGYKDWGRLGLSFDASNKDDSINGGYNPFPWRVLGMYQPDSVVSFNLNGKNYFITANEGDARDYGGYSEEVRVKDLNLDYNNTNQLPSVSLTDMAKLEGLKKAHISNVDPSASFLSDIRDLKSIGEVTALIPEASTAEGNASLLMDGQSGDTQFPYLSNMKALATVGEFDPQTGYTLTGYPDGQAAWLEDNSTIRVAYQSESYATMGKETYPWEMSSGVTFTGSHIHTIDYDRSAFADFLKNNDPASSMFKSSGKLFHTIYNVFGNKVVPKDKGGLWGNQTDENGTIIEFADYMQLSEADFFFQSFCGAWYEKKNRYGSSKGFVDDVWLTAEEWSIRYMFPNYSQSVADSTMGLASIVVDIANETAYTVPALGQTGYEKLMPINPGHTDYVVLVLAGYNHGQEPAPNKIYVGIKGRDANGTVITSSASTRDQFLSRNGLLYGKIYGLAVANADYNSTLGIATPDPTAKMMDAYLKDANASNNFSGKFYPTSFRWDGFDTPEAVKDTEMMLWEKTSEQPTGYTFFNGDTKTEHPAADPDITKHRFIQNMTDEGGLLGFDFGDLAAQLTAASGDLPLSLDVNVTRLVAAVDGAMTLDVGGKGVGNGTTETAAKHIEKNATKMVAPDGLFWAKTADADILIVDEDSGNDYGERKYALILNPTTFEVNSTGYFLAQAGGNKNVRASYGISAYGNTFDYATTSEFSGSWNVSALVARKANGSFYSPSELAGTQEDTINQQIDHNDSKFIGVLQHRSESGGPVANFRNDRGGQILMFGLDLPVGGNVPTGSAQHKALTFLEANSLAYTNPNEDIKDSDNLGRLKTTTANGDADGDGLYETIYAYGGRSFSIWDENGKLVFDSGNDLEKIVRERLPNNYHASNTVNAGDNRSDDKGTEPEGLTIGKIGDKIYAFIGLERVGGVVVYDISQPDAPVFLDYVNNRDFAFAPYVGDDDDNAVDTTNAHKSKDLGPEGLVFVSGMDSPTGSPLLIVANEVSGTTTVYQMQGNFPLHPVSDLIVRSGTDALHLQWKDTNNQELGYDVYRKASDEAVFSIVASLSANVSNWTDETVVSGKSYAYRVDAYNANYTSSSIESELFAPIKPILNLLSTYNPAKEDYAEVPAFDPLTNRIFVSNGEEKRVDVMELDRKGVVTFKFSLPIPSTFGGINAVSVSNGILAVAVEAPVKQNNGGVLFYDTRVKNGGSPITTVSVGALPDHLTFTPDGLKLVVANEGEPSDDYTNDPKGSISIIDVSKINQIRNDSSSSLTLPVTTLDFTAYDSKKAELIAKGVRIFGKNASVSQDLEPEYVAISADSTKAFVTLQENNALAFVDLATSSITDIKPLGYKDYNALGLAFDSNDKDKSYNPYPWPVLGMYQPDSIVSFTIDNAGPPAFQEVNSAYSNTAFTGGSDSTSYKSRSIATLSMTGAEISDYDPANKVLYVVGGGNDLLTVDLSNPANPVLANNISLGATAQSVAVKDGYVAIALSNSTDKTQNGTVALYTVATKDKNASLVTTFTAGALPDSVAFSNDGNVIVVANEGEPNDAYTVDPEGSITVIRLNRKNPTASVVHQLDFSSFTASNLTAAGVRLSGPNKNVPTKDLEPEYVTIAPNGEKAFVSLQENNAIAIVDLLSDIPKIESVVGAGIKDWSVGGLKVDTTDKDSGVNFGSASFKGLNMPDGMDSYTAGDGRTYFIAANEGDGREYEDNDVISYTDENRSKDFGLTIGGGDRIKMTTWDKNDDGSISADERFAFGGRSITIYDDEGTLVFDSGDLLDTKANEVGSYPDGRSDDKGSEPEGVEIANIGGRSIAFIAMERSSTVAVFDVTNPKDSVFLEMIKLNASLVSPEGLKYISAEDSGNGKDLLVISAEYLKGIEIIEFSPPSAMDVYSSEFLITANEGDARDYGGYSEETRVGDLTLDYNGTGLHKFSPDYPDAEQSLTADKFNLSRLKTTTANGDIDGDGKYEEIYSYGARSFSIWSAKDGSLVYDSGVDLEKIVQQTYPDKFNIDDDDVDKRSDDKGVEPEGLAVGKVDGRTFAFIGLERQSGIIIYDVTDPLQPQFVQYANNRDYSKDFDSKEAGDVGPEGLTFVSADNSPTGYPLLIVTNEVSGSTSVWGMSNLPVGPVKGLNIHQDADVSILSWDDTSSVENGFIIYRQEGIGSPFEEIGRVGRNVTTFYDAQVQPGESYMYKVNAYNEISESKLSQVKVAQADLRLTILHANDAEQLMPTALGDGYYGGAAMFISKIKDLRSEFNSKGQGVLSISAGDNLMPGRELSASLGGDSLYHSMFLDQAGFEFVSIGNHEFDAGPDVTASFIKSAKYPTFLSSNLDFSAHKPLNDLFTTNKIVKSTQVDVTIAGKTIKVGLVGATTKNLNFISSPSPVVVDANVAGSVQAEVDSLTANGAKLVILVSHLQGVSEELTLLTQLSGVDVVIAGGGDNRLANPSDKLIPGESAEGSYPLIGLDKDGSAVPVVTVDGQLKYIGRLTLNITSSGEVTGWNGGPQRIVDSGIDQFHGTSPDIIAYETIENPIEKYVSSLSAQKISNEISFALDGGKDDIRSRETNLGNLVADSQLWVAQAYAKDKNAPVADVALANGGGIRASINESRSSNYKASVDDTYTVLPFGNIVTVVPDVSAAEFKLLLENAYSKTVLSDGKPKREGDGTGRFAQIAGFRVEYDIEANPMIMDNNGIVTQQGVRVVNATMIDGKKIIENGIPADNMSLNVAIVDFLADNKGDQYFTFRSGAINNVKLGFTYQAALAEYISVGLNGDLSKYEKPDGRIKFDAKASSDGAKASSASGFFPGARKIEGDWKELSWFGTFWDKEFPWIYHAEHGWLYAGGTGGASMWFYDLQTGWWWTNEQHYPYVYLDSVKDWVFYQPNTQSKSRFFYLFSDGGKWVTYPQSGQ